MCPNLNTTHGEEFEKLYLSYEEDKKFKKQVKARDLWKHIMESQIETGFPYMLYKDQANNKSNQKNLGTIRSSNLCVSGDTEILTKNGNIKIKELENQNVQVWNGEVWSDVTVMKTGENQDLTEITFKNEFDAKYTTIKCTPYHKFYICDEDEDNNSKEARAHELKIGDKIYPFELDNNILYNKIKVTNVKTNVSNEDTYCFTEPLRNRGVFNNILTGNCAEIVEYSDAKATAVCNLASICLPRYVKTSSIDGKIEFDYIKLMEVVRVIVRNLNKIIDRNFYPTESTEDSNKAHRPIGIGVQGLADVYNAFLYPYDSLEAAELNKKIFETIYFASLDESKELAKKDGKYSSFKGSPFSMGKLQFNLWGMNISDLSTKDEYDWSTLTNEIKQFGTRNSLLTALMPTAGTSQIMKCYESFEPYMSNLFVRTTMAGEFIVINEKLIFDLIKEGLWSEDMRKLIIIKNGSIQSIDCIPKHIKNIYKTAFELSLKNIISQSADRAPFVDQSQSMNLFMAKPDFTLLTSAHFYGWKRGLKTGMYYLRTTPAVNPIQFGIDISDLMRLSGVTNAIDLINSDYNIISSKSLDVKIQIVEQSADTTLEEDDDDPWSCPVDPEERKKCTMCSG
jgi:ribonucleotide reductase alpha subunit